MKTKTTILLSGLLALSAASAQTVHTVDNRPGSVAMYDNFTAAYEAATAGDTILLAGSPTYYGSHTLHKPLRIEGPGYFLEANKVPGVNRDSARIGLDVENSIQFGNASGCTLVGLDGSIRVFSGVEGTVVDRCSLEVGSFSSATILRRCYGNTISFDLGSVGSVILNSNIGSVGTGNTVEAGVSVDKSIIRNEVNAGGASSVQVTNSIFTSVSNQLIRGPASVSYCMAISDGLPVGSGNQNNQLLIGAGAIFERFDSRYDIAVLRSDSPALGAGIGGSDIGIEGGVTPYVPGGVPARPRVTLLAVPNSATDTSGLTFEVEAVGIGE